MKLGLFGGSFDPIHRGHVDSAAAARRMLGLDRILFLPTARPPHKTNQELTPAWARYAMVELALLEAEGCFASPFELSPPRVAYTVDTVGHFRQAHPEAELFLLLGADSYLSLHRWRRWREIVASVALAVLARPGWDPEQPSEGAPEDFRPRLAAARVHVVENPPLPISSTELRESLGRGEEPPPDTVPDLVLRYIHKYALYRPEDEP